MGLALYLIPIFVIFPFSVIFITGKVVWAFAARQSMLRRRLLSWLSMFLVAIVFYGDIVFINLLHERLCNNHAGTYIYKSVVVADDMWDYEEGTLHDKYFGSDAWEGNNWEGNNMSAPFIFSGSTIVDHWGGISTERHYLYENHTGEKLYEHVSFSAPVGWLQRLAGFDEPPHSSSSCDYYEHEKVIREMPINLTAKQKSLLPSKYSDFMPTSRVVIRPESDN